MNTKLESLMEQRRSGKATCQKATILRYLRKFHRYGHTRSELSEALDMYLSSVCGRVNELISSGLVVEEESRRCKITGRHAKTLKPKDPYANI